MKELMKELGKGYFGKLDKGYRIRMFNLDHSVWDSFKTDINEFKLFRSKLALKYLDILHLTHKDEAAIEYLINNIDSDHKKYFFVQYYSAFDNPVLDKEFVA